MNAGDVMLRTILENPKDDHTRRVYADWIEEQGDAGSADFIRRQVGGEAVTPPHSWTTAIEQWVGPTNRIKWLCGEGKAFGETRRAKISVTYERGFLSELAMPIRAFVKAAPDIFSRHPVRAVRPSDRSTFYWRGEEGVWFGEGPAGRDSCFIPSPIFALLPGGTKGCCDDGLAQNPRARPYDYRVYLGGEHEAFTALVVACVRFGRRSVGLSELPPIECIPSRALMQCGMPTQTA